mmetsp:Transcript_4027/g.13039  ORF Transcript_4027/g.13039 Transcript_4027/m.13039 type:complete len:234 (-) Transcript_4027:976-1677(-)
MPLKLTSSCGETSFAVPSRSKLSTSLSKIWFMMVGPQAPAGVRFGSGKNFLLEGVAPKRERSARMFALCTSRFPFGPKGLCPRFVMTAVAFRAPCATTAATAVPSIVPPSAKKQVSSFPGCSAVLMRSATSKGPKRRGRQSKKPAMPKKSPLMARTVSGDRWRADGGWPKGLHAGGRTKDCAGPLVASKSAVRCGVRQGPHPFCGRYICLSSKLQAPSGRGSYFVAAECGVKT